MRHAIRHDRTGRAIVAYLAAAEGSRWVRHIVGYMNLMHATPAGCTRQMLCDLVQRGEIERTRRGHYQRGEA
jgi:hypothetical protein